MHSCALKLHKRVTRGPPLHIHLLISVCRAETLREQRLYKSSFGWVAVAHVLGGGAFWTCLGSSRCTEKLRDPLRVAVQEHAARKHMLGELPLDVGAEVQEAQTQLAAVR